jgi:2-keto-3-deoxy-L-rhamnonate aldolase RhmA
VTATARVPDIGSSTILRYLDRGIMGILGPHIATDDALQLVRTCHFGPLGEHPPDPLRESVHRTDLAAFPVARCDS